MNAFPHSTEFDSTVEDVTGALDHLAAQLQVCANGISINRVNHPKELELLKQMSWVGIQEFAKQHRLRVMGHGRGTAFHFRPY